MGCKFYPYLWIMFIFTMQYYSYSTDGAPQVPCYFVFGDSLSDNGNNNLLVTLAKAKYSPYGIDFPQGPTGRFTNGLNMADVIATLLGFDHYIPPFATATGPVIMQGVNYASGAAGILSESSSNLGDRVTMNEQLANHRITIARITDMLTNSSNVVDLLSKCIYTVDMGINDYLNNYLLRTTRPPPEEFADQLIEVYSQQLKNLYGKGAMKVAVFGIELSSDSVHGDYILERDYFLVVPTESNAGPLGCTPRVLATFPRNNGSQCVDFVNNAVNIFNTKLVSLISGINANLTGAKFTYIDSFGIDAADLTPIGIKFLNVSCCQIIKGIDLCIPLLPPCANKSEYAFWDEVHPTENLNVYTAGRAYTALLPIDGVPYDISDLARL